MDSSTVQQQPIPGNELALNSNSAGQAINVPNGHGDSEECIPSPVDYGISNDDAAVDDGGTQSPLLRESADASDELR